MATIPALIWLLLTASVVLARDHGEHHDDDGDYYKGQLLAHKGHHAMEGEKHIDTHDQDEGTEHMAKSLDHKGKDKSNTNTQAQLTTTLKAKDKHSESYSHLHDNAHETEAMADNDHIRGDDTELGLEHDMFREAGHHGPHADLHHEREGMYMYPSDDWDGIDHDHYEHLLGDHDGYDAHDMDMHHAFGHGGRLDGDIYTGHDNMNFFHGHGDLGHHGYHGGDVPWVAGDHF